jgi:hypothetical protein
MIFSPPTERRFPHMLMSMKLAGMEESDGLMSEWMKLEALRMKTEFGIVVPTMTENPLRFWAMTQLEGEWAEQRIPKKRKGKWKDEADYTTTMLCYSIKHMVEEANTYFKFPGLKKLSTKKGIDELLGKAGMFYNAEGLLTIKGDPAEGIPDTLVGHESYAIDE